MSLNVAQLELQAKEKLASVKDLGQLEAFRIEFLGKKSSLSAILEGLKDLPLEEKRTVGKDANQFKRWLESQLDELKKVLAGQSKAKDSFDISLPPLRPRTGRKHPILQTIDEIVRVFHKLGFDVVDGPEIETDFHNFTALNIPADHVSRDAVDTFYTDNGFLLRSQTSTVQIRTMQSRKPPLRIIAPGRVYRPDTVDASHSFMFHQIEGLVVDEKVSFSDLKGILHLFLRELFGSDTKIRFRPHFFPFTEPSVEVDIMGKKGWLEILGAGSVHPNVFEAVGIDSKKYQGLAFGLGVERITMLRHGIHDIRLFYENDMRFLEQF